MDIIFIEKLIVMTVIGVYEWEQQRLQKLVFDLEIGYNNQLAVQNNNILDCLNYVDITESVTSLVSSKSFKLLEQVAEETANQLINQFQLPWVRIKVRKPGAIPQALNVGVIIERSSNNFKIK